MESSRLYIYLIKPMGKRCLKISYSLCDCFSKLFLINLFKTKNIIFITAVKVCSYTHRLNVQLGYSIKLFRNIETPKNEIAVHEYNKNVPEFINKKPYQHGTLNKYSTCYLIYIKKLLLIYKKEHATLIKDIRCYFIKISNMVLKINKVYGSLYIIRATYMGVVRIQNCNRFVEVNKDVGLII